MYLACQMEKQHDALKRDMSLVHRSQPGGQPWGTAGDCGRGGGQLERKRRSFTPGHVHVAQVSAAQW